MVLKVVVDELFVVDDDHEGDNNYNMNLQGVIVRYNGICESDCLIIFDH